MMSRKISFFEFWRSQKERGALLKRADELRLQPAQLKCLLGDSAVRSELQNTRMASLLPPVGTEVFRRFIPASLEEIQQRHEAEEKERQRRKNKEVEDKGLPKQATHLEAGKPLPFIYGDPPPELLNTPLEELDPFYQSQKTFIVLSKGNIIHRFNAESTCYLLSPFSPMRTTTTRILIHSLFRLFILLTLLTNCVFMIIGYPPAWRRTVEYVFIAIYTFEVVIKILSQGLCVGYFTFLRDPWNWLDVMVICTAFLTHSVYVGKLSVLSTIPRGLKMISVYPGVKRTAGALIQSVKRLTAVIVLMVFVLSILALIGLQLFMGNLRQKCVKWPESLGNLTDTGNQTGSSDFDFHEYISHPGNLYFLPGELDALLCGNISDARVCPDGYVCVRGGSNPNYGYTSYDSFGWSLLALFRLMTQDFWENLFQLMLQTAGKTFVIIFMLLVFPVCFCLISLFLVVVAMASVEQHMARVAEAKQKEDEFIQIQEVMKRREEKEEEEEQAACRVELSEQQDSAPQKKNSAGVITCPPCCLAVLRWNCCGCWRWLKQRLYTLIMNPFFDFGIVVCIVIDCIFFAMEHYPMTEEFDECLSIANLVFIGIYTAEMILKLLALDPYGYFQVRWNIYESIVVIVCWLELIFIDVEGLSTLVGVEVVMRMLRLARWWPTLHTFMKVIWTSVRALRNLTLVLLIMVFLFTIAGTQLFQEDYGNNVCRISENCGLPRWHMYDFFHTFILIFRALCGEWIETMWDCMEVSGPTMCLIFYMMVLIIGNLLVLNLFLALLLNFFNNDNPKEKEENNVQIAIAQIKGGVTHTRIWILQHMWTLLGKRNYMKPDHKVADSTKDTKECLGLTCVTSDQPVSDVKAPGGKYDSTTFRRVPEAEAEIEFKTPENEEKEEKKQQDEDNANHRGNTPEDCCCDSCYRCCPFLDVDTSRGPGRVWSNFRRACFSVVQHKYFETFIIFIILLSSAALVFEDVHLQQRQVLQMVLDKADQVFAYLFLLEMVLKWIGCGFRKYFTSAWCWLDFLILAVSLVSIALGMLGYSELGAGLSLKTVRALRPLRALSRFQGLRVVLKVLGVTLPAMCDVLFVVLFVWCIFSVTGVHLFAGKSYYCLNETSDSLFLPEDVNNKTECLSLIQQNYTEVRWKNIKIHYDSVATGYLSLLQVATFKGWIDIMYSAVDSRQVESQPVFESNLYMYLYFICFIIIGRFFTFNFFIRVFIDTLDQFGGKHVFMTEEQQKHLWAMKKLFSKKPQKPVPRPQNKCQALLFDLVTKQCFEVFMVVVICLNMVILMVETQQDSMEKEFILHWFNFSFYLVFFIEFLLKITALRQHYFSDYLNILDFVIIFFSTVDLFIADLVEKYFFPQSLLPILRLGRISRIIHLFRWAQRIQTLLAAFMMSLPALFNICLLLFLLMFTFSSFGMFSFAHVKKEAMINDTFNFETFVNSMICLFTIITTAGWDGLLFPILNTPPDCDPDLETPGSAVRGNCGSPTVGIIFFTSYIILSMLLVVHLFIAVILETFSVEDIERLSDGDLQMFYKAWRKFDPDGSQVIQYSQLSDFCDALQGPLRIPKPNTIKLIHMDLPLLPGDKIHCVDVLLTLTAQVFGDSGETDALKATMEEKFTANNSCKVSYEPISSTLRRRQEEIAATVIQRAYRKHLLQDRDSEETVTESAGGASGAPGV